MAEDLFTRQGAWDGGFYELALELGPATEQEFRKTLIRLWSHPRITGCYFDQNIEPEMQDWILLDETIKFELLLGHPMGTVLLPNNERTNCSSTVIRELPTESGGITNWVTLNLPLGGLVYSYPFGGFPFEKDQKLEVRREIDEMLKEIGEYMYSEVKFKLGLIGFEPDTVPDHKEYIQGKIPEVRYSGCLKPRESELLYFPATK